MEKDKILTISELVTLYDKGELEGEHFICYMTERHRQTDSRGYTPREMIVALSDIRKGENERFTKLLWGLK